MAKNNGTVLITGASSGIGKATAMLMHEEGFRVVATAPQIDDLMPLHEIGIIVAELDVTDEDSAARIVERAEEPHGVISILINNAGYGQYGPIEEIPLSAVREQFEVNVFGLIRMCQLVLPGMRRAGSGRIINLSSVAGEIKQPGTGIYHATKHAVEAIDGALRSEVDGFGIHVIGILPGPVNTDFDDVAISSIPDTGPNSPYLNFKANLVKTTRDMLDPNATGILEPEDVARKILEAATVGSPSARYHVGMMSKVMSVANDLLPDAIWDAAMKYQTPVDEPKK